MVNEGRSRPTTLLSQDPPSFHQLSIQIPYSGLRRTTLRNVISDKHRQ